MSMTKYGAVPEQVSKTAQKNEKKPEPKKPEPKK